LPQWPAHFAATCRHFSPAVAGICRHLPQCSVQFPRNLTFTYFLPSNGSGGLSCALMTETAQRKRGGRAYHSVLEPHFDFIRQQRQRRKTWQEIADLLFSEKGIRVTFYAPYRFYRRRLKRAAKPNWENSAGEIQPVNPANQPPSRPAPLPKQNTFNRPNIKNINTDQEFT
jgi:hypothetical protein